MGGGVWHASAKTVAGALLLVVAASLWQAATPAGISAATVPQGAKSTGKLYFDITGPAPTQVVYTNAGTDLLLRK